MEAFLRRNALTLCAVAAVLHLVVVAVVCVRHIPWLELQAELTRLSERDSARELALFRLQQQVEYLVSAAPPGAHAGGPAVDPLIPVVVLTHRRVDYLRKCLTTLLKYHMPSFPLIVSQDGDSEPLIEKMVREEFGDNVMFIQHKNRPPVPRRFPQHLVSYFYISMHFRFILHTVFEKLRYQQVILVEDDLDISPDFFEYFKATVPILEKDESLWCVSAWNDLGQKHLVKDPWALRRTDFFPGLGWMINKRVWNELKNKWPDSFWDDWMREPEQRKGRQCIQPEVCRTFTFGEEGTSNGQFFDKYLKNIRLNKETVRFTLTNLTYLERDNWDALFLDVLRGAIVISDLRDDYQHKMKNLVYIYNDKKDFDAVAARMNIMSDWKAGVPRSSYKGVVHVWTRNKNKLFLVPRTLNITSGISMERPGAPAQQPARVGGAGGEEQSPAVDAAEVDRHHTAVAGVSAAEGLRGGQAADGPVGGEEEVRGYSIEKPLARIFGWPLQSEEQAAAGTPSQARGG